MATYGLSAQGDHLRSTIAEAKSLTVDRLKKVLRNEGLPVSGIKSELQIRLIAHIEKCAAIGDHDSVSRIRNLIRGITGSYPNPYPSPYSTNTPTTSLSPQFASPTPRPTPSMPYQMSPAYPPARVTFKNSPFYSIVRPLAPAQELKAREHTRDTARINVMLDLQAVESLQRDSNTRVMVFCAPDSFENRHLPCDISFPQHGELKCNSDDVKVNLRGLKNKPGTTRPADVTSFIRKKANFPNAVELVYALTNKKFYLVVNLVQKKPVETLLTELKRGKFISKERVIKEMQTKASDPDIVATSSIMSLKDPVQMTRIETPCRSISCKHNECFDAAAYLQLQEQAPTWTCPCCNRSAPWETLIFDQYFDEILHNVSSNIDQVTVEPDGNWHIGDTQNALSGHGNDDDSDEDNDDDELVMISDPRQSIAKEFIRTPSVVRTPPLAGPSTAPMSQSGNKRKHAETIDLTADDSDEDDQPPRPPPKRSDTNSSTSYPSFTSQNQYHSPPTINAPFHFRMPPPPPSPSGYHPNGYYPG